MLDNSFIAEFEALAGKYGLPKEGDVINEKGQDQLASNYQILLQIYVGRRRRRGQIDSRGGQYYTSEEIVSDFSAFEIARMLKQIAYATGSFKVSFDGWTEGYCSPTLVEVLKQSLTEALSQSVKKGNGVLVLCKGYGGGDTGRVFIVELPEGVKPQQEGFSEEELDAIIHYEKVVKDAWEKTQGNKERNKAKKEEERKTKLPELGRMAQFIVEGDMQEQGQEGLLPTDWQDVKKYNFVAEYLVGAGFLDFKGENWLRGFGKKDRKEKDRMVRNWMKAYKTYRDSLK